MGIIWNRAGILVPIIFFAFFAGISWFVGIDTWQNSIWPQIIAVSISSILVGFIGIGLNHPNTQENESSTINSGGTHSFMFVPMQYWFFLIPILWFSISWYGGSVKEEQIEMLSNPQLNDLYRVESKGVFGSETEGFPYQILKVTGVNGQKIYFVEASKVQSQPEYVDDAINNRDYEKRDYFIPTKHETTINELLKWHKDNALTAVYRPE